MTSNNDVLVLRSHTRTGRHMNKRVAYIRRLGAIRICGPEIIVGLGSNDGQGYELRLSRAAICRLYEASNPTS